MRIYKDCDVRGVFGRELTAAEVYRIDWAEVYPIGWKLASTAPSKFLASGDVRA